MSRNQLVFVLIVGAALAIVGIGLAMQAFSGGGANNNQTSTTAPTAVGEPIVLEVAVNSIIRPWLTQAVRDYNNTNPTVNNRPITIRLVEQESLEVWASGGGVWSDEEHPHIWIPEAGYVINYASPPLEFETIQSSIAQTPVIWGVYEDYHRTIASKYGNFDGKGVQQAAEAENWEAIGGNSRWQFVQIAFSRPDRTGAGLASLFALGVEYQGRAVLNDDLMTDAAFQEWLEPIINAVPNFSNLGSDPAGVMATRPGTSDIGLLPESQWLNAYARLNSNSSNGAFRLIYPTNYVLLDFPFAIWSELEGNERRAAENFANFLLNESQQSAAGESGLRPAIDNLDLREFTLFSQNADVQLELSGNPIQMPSRSGAQSIIRWFSSYRGSTP